MAQKDAFRSRIAGLGEILDSRIVLFIGQQQITTQVPNQGHIAVQAWNVILIFVACPDADFLGHLEILAGPWQSPVLNTGSTKITVSLERILSGRTTV